MTNKASQVTIPINATTLFTTLLGVAIMGCVGYMLTKVQESNDNIIRIIEKQDQYDAVIATNTQKINDIITTRFTDRDGAQLMASIMAEITTTLAPLQASITILQNDVARINRQPPCSKGEVE